MWSSTVFHDASRRYWSGVSMHGLTSIPRNPGAPAINGIACRSAASNSCDRPGTICSIACSTINRCLLSFDFFANAPCVLFANTQRNPRANDRRTGRNPARFLRADVLKIEFCNLLSVNWLAKKHLVKLPLASVRESYPLHALIGCIVINQFKRGLFEP